MQVEECKLTNGSTGLGVFLCSLYAGSRLSTVQFDFERLFAATEPQEE